GHMKTVTFTEFRKNASGLFSDVERGEVFLVIRHGKPIAEVSPVRSSDSLPAWKQAALRLAVRGGALSAAILGERTDEDLL
ncbi:MAG: type II toxin-antitoxin system Phd/YefM family antitoxin, partial [Gemmatimonadota bacterium]|nr:type II toxin-antitoxin system Phd/YefM family antitoxin [Gemmatimonadota bacterium]